jgi:hypothetical protein
MNEEDVQIGFGWKAGLAIYTLLIGPILLGELHSRSWVRAFHERETRPLLQLDNTKAVIVEKPD